MFVKPRATLLHSDGPSLRQWLKLNQQKVMLRQEKSSLKRSKLTSKKKEYRLEKMQKERVNNSEIIQQNRDLLHMAAALESDFLVLVPEPHHVSLSQQEFSKLNSLVTKRIKIKCGKTSQLP